MIDQLWLFAYVVVPVVVAAVGYFGVSLFLGHNGAAPIGRVDSMPAPEVPVTRKKKKPVSDGGTGGEDGASHLVRHAAE